MKKYLPELVLIVTASVPLALLNLHAISFPYFAEATVIYFALSLIVIAYRNTLAFAKPHTASTAMQLIYRGLVASIIIFISAQFIRLFAAIIYALTFLTDSQALAIQIHFVLPSFIGGTTNGFGFVVMASFFLGFAVVLPLVWYTRMRRA